MIKRLLLIMALSVSVSGCFMAPMVFIGPAASGFSTASIIQTGITTSANYVVKQSTGKTISQHAFDAINNDVYKHSYFPKEESPKIKKKSKN